MTRIKLSLVALLLLFHTACVSESNINFDKESSVKTFSKEEQRNLNDAYHQAKILMNKLDLKKAEEEFSKILAIVPYNLYNDDYIFALLAEAKLYARFELVEKAEFVTLKACGLSDELADEISMMTTSTSKDEVDAVIKKLEKNIDQENYYGFHVAKSFVHKISSLTESSNYDKLRGEVKQGRYDLHLYPSLLRFRGMKMKRTKKLDFLKEKLKTVKGDEHKKIEEQIAFTYLLLAKFDAASAIADIFLAKDKNDINSLYIKMNIAMSSGKFDEMKGYEKRIEKINPNAFK